MDTGAKEAPRGFSQHSLILKKALKTFWPHRVAHSFSCFSLLARVAIWKRYPVFTGVAGWVNTDGVFSLLAERLMNLALGTGFFRRAVWWEEQTEANQERLEAIFSYLFLSFPSIKFRPTHDHLIGETPWGKLKKEWEDSRRAVRLHCSSDSDNRKRGTMLVMKCLKLQCYISIWQGQWQVWEPKLSIETPKFPSSRPSSVSLLHS